MVKFRTRNNNGESNTTKYQEHWTGDVSDAIGLFHTYSTNGHSVLTGVRVRSHSNRVRVLTAKTINVTSVPAD